MIVVKFKDGRKIKGYVEYREGVEYPFFSAVGKPSDKTVVGGSYKTFDEAVEKGLKATNTRTMVVSSGCSVENHCGRYEFIYNGEIL